MTKTITSSQLLGEIGETAVRLRFLNMGFQFDGRSRLEAGVDGIAEVMDKGKPLARMIAVQVKATESARYASEDEVGFSYLLRPADLAYWRGSNLPVIIVLYRKSDESYFWKEVGNEIKEERRLQFFNDLHQRHLPMTAAEDRTHVRNWVECAHPPVDATQSNRICIVTENDPLVCR